MSVQFAFEVLVEVSFWISLAWTFDMMRPGWIGRKEAFRFHGTADLLLAFQESVEGDTGGVVVYAAAGAFWFFMAHHEDDDDEPRNRRRRARVSLTARLRDFTPSPIPAPAA